MFNISYNPLGQTSPLNINNIKINALTLKPKSLIHTVISVTYSYSV